MNKIDELRCHMETCDKCPSLAEHRSQVVFGTGSTTPKIFIVGEAPGQTEDEDGIPFNPERGRSGQQLEKILNWVGIERSECFISNSVLCRPPNNRNPRFEEIKACRPRLMKQVDLLRPEVVVCLGKFAVVALLGQEFKGPLKKLFSDTFLSFELNGHDYKWIATYHPAYLLRSVHNKRVVVPHWQLIKEYLSND